MLYLFVYAFPDAKPLHTFAGNAYLQQKSDTPFRIPLLNSSLQSFMQSMQSKEQFYRQDHHADRYHNLGNPA